MFALFTMSLVDFKKEVSIMKSVIQRSSLLVVSAFFILTLSSSAFPFPSIQTNEFNKENWTFPGDSHNFTKTSISSDNQVLTDNVLRAKLWNDATNVGTNPLNNTFFENSVYFSTNVQDQDYWNSGFADPYRETDAPSLAAGMVFNTGLEGSSDYTPHPTPPAVPEPATIALMVVGLFGMGMLQRWRQAKTA
jgi:hypothetical protein